MFSPKGGVGTTTVATNIALVAAEAQTNPALLVDLDLSFGQVASHLNLQPKQSLLELTRDESALRETELFRTYADPPERPPVIPAPPSPGFASLVTTEQVEHGSPGRSRPTRWSSSTRVDPRRAMLTIFARSEAVVVPVAPEIPALNAVHTLLDQLVRQGRSAVGRCSC